MSRTRRHRKEPEHEYFHRRMPASVDDILKAGILFGHHAIENMLLRGEIERLDEQSSIDTMYALIANGTIIGTQTNSDVTISVKTRTGIHLVVILSPAELYGNQKWYTKTVLTWDYFVANHQSKYERQSH